MLFHDPGGVPDDFRSGGKGFTCDERPAADHGIISNRRALQDSRPVTDPNMIPDAYASGRINPFSFRVQHGVTVPGSDTFSAKMHFSPMSTLVDSWQAIMLGPLA